ncbi:MAG TPA: hypothetical protein DD490_01780 [Acidobacteria bacterium]|nr:hypothetical protein [Acidobacteriota bacterium]
MGLSLAAGVALMVGHRRLARPYMREAMLRKCVWCNRVLSEREGVVLAIRARNDIPGARCCAGHEAPAARFFTVLDTWRLPLRIGIFVPLLTLLVALAAAALGREILPLPAATSFFQLAIGLTVHLAAAGSLFVRAGAEPPTVTFPVHNFFLLGVRTLLWIFRLVGLWWIWAGGTFFFPL